MSISKYSLGNVPARLTCGLEADFVSQLWWHHRELRADLGADAESFGFEVEWLGGFVGACEGDAAAAACEGDPGGAGALGAGVGEFDQGGDGGVQGSCVFVGALDGVSYCLSAGFAVYG